MPACLAYHILLQVAAVKFVIVGTLDLFATKRGVVDPYSGRARSPDSHGVHNPTFSISSQVRVQRTSISTFSSVPRPAIQPHARCCHGSMCDAQRSKKHRSSRPAPPLNSFGRFGVARLASYLAWLCAASGHRARRAPTSVLADSSRYGGKFQPSVVKKRFQSGATARMVASAVPAGLRRLARTRRSVRLDP
jgi:hypothetical protein